MFSSEDATRFHGSEHGFHPHDMGSMAVDLLLPSSAPVLSDPDGGKWL